jgi:hypothetical protein
VLGVITTGLLVVVLIGVVGLATLLEAGFFTPRILAFVNERLEAAGGLHLTTASLYWRPWSGLNIEDARLTLRAPVAEPDSASSEQPAAGFSAAPHRVLAAIDAVEVGYRIGDLLVGRPRIRRIRVLRPDVDLAAITRWRERTAEPESPAGDESEPGRLLPGGFVVEDFRIVRGRVEREAGVLLSDLDLTGSLHGVSGHWSLAVEEAATRVTAEHVDEFVELTGNMSFAEGAIGLDGLHFKAGGGRVSFQGRIDPAGWKARVLTTGYAIPLERIGSWVQVEHPLLTGNLEFRFLASGTIDSLDVNGGLRGVAEDETGRDVVFSLSRRGPKFGIDSVRLETGDSRVDVSAQLVLDGDPRIDGVATFRTLDPALLLAEEDLSRVTDLDGTVRFEGVGLSRETFEGSVEAASREGSPRFPAWAPSTLTTASWRSSPGRWTIWEISSWQALPTACSGR